MNNVDQPLVSVVIPSYNHGQYLGRALQGLIDQTYKNWEALIVDNYSTDNTDEIIERYSDERISVLKINNNGVIAKSRNIGINQSSGEWIAFLDSDDWWHTYKLQECMAHVNSNVDLIYHVLSIKMNKQSYLQRSKINSWQLQNPILEDLLRSGNAIPTSSVVVRSAVVKKMGGMNECPAMVGAEDYNTWLRIAKVSNKFKYLPIRLGWYYLQSSSVSSQKDMSIPIRYAIAEFRGELDKDQKKKCNARLRYARGRFLFLSRKYKRANLNLYFSLLYGGLEIKCKSMYMLIVMRLNSLLSRE